MDGWILKLVNTITAEPQRALRLTLYFALKNLVLWARLFISDELI